MQGRALDLQEAAVVVAMMVSVVVEGGCLPHQHLLEWDLPPPGVAGDGASVVASTQGPHLPL